LRLLVAALALLVSTVVTNWTTLPHERLIAFQVARKLLLAVSEAKISDPKLGTRHFALPRARA
jgi:hypothetical protein